MSHSWDDTYDVIVVGGCAAGMATARAAAADGLDVLVLAEDGPADAATVPGLQLWPFAPLRSLLVDDDGGVAGVRIDQHGTSVRLRAKAGVVLTPGRFGRDLILEVDDLASADGPVHDDRARVLRADGSVIDGLYVTGTSATTHLTTTGDQR